MRYGVVAGVAMVAAGVAVAVAVRQWRRSRERTRRKTRCILRKFARECATPVTKLCHMADDMAVAMQAGLDSNGQPTNLAMLVAYLKQLPIGWRKDPSPLTFLRSLPSIKVEEGPKPFDIPSISTVHQGRINLNRSLSKKMDEKGLNYGVNIRANDFLILRARLGGKNEPISDLLREEFSFPSHVMRGTSKELFDFIALQLATFISTHENQSTNDASQGKRNLGVTLSYPVGQAKTTAIKWKSFSVDDAVEKQLMNEMNQALEKHGLQMNVSAMADETIGDLAGGRYYNKETVAAITLGQATNASYIETPEAVLKFNGPSEGELVIDTQWGNFTSSHLPITEFDVSLDAESSNPSSRVFEKLISGMYLGEVVRRVLLKMAKETALFGRPIPPKLTIPYLLRSPDMAAMHQDTSEDHRVVGEKLKEIFGTSSTPMAREVVAEVCDIVAERGARLAGAGIVAITKRLGRISNKKSVIIVEGGLYEHYRVFRNYLHSSVWEMLGTEVSDNVIIDHSHGGSGAGSLFLAASQSNVATS